MDDFLLRNGGLEDLDSLTRLDGENFLTPWTRDGIQRAVEDEKAITVVAEKDGRLVGFSLAWVVMDEVHLFKIAVDALYRRRGIGRRIIARTLETARQKDGALMFLEVRDTAAAAQAFYKSLGFVTAGRRRKYYADTGEDAILMILEFA